VTTPVDDTCLMVHVKDVDSLDESVIEFGECELEDEEVETPEKEILRCLRIVGMH